MSESELPPSGEGTHESDGSVSETPPVPPAAPEDLTATEPISTGAAAPAPAAPVAAPPVQEAAAPAPAAPVAVPPVQEGAVESGTAPRNRSNRRRGRAGQVVGVTGIVVSLALIVVVVLGRGWLVGSVDDVTGSINDGLGKGVTLVDTASGRISDLASQVGAISDAASALASNPNPAPGLSAALSAKLQPLTDRYLALRSAYTDLRTNVVAAADRLQTLDRLLPFISIPQGPADALQTLDSKLQALDASITELLTTPGSGAVNAVAGGIATRAANVEAGLQSVTTALDDVSTRITTLQGNVQQKADQVKLLINVVTLLLILGLLYSVFLHWVLFRSGSSLRARNSGS